MISVKGIRIESVSLNKEADAWKIKGDYSLMSSTDKVLAKQAVNGYNEVAVNPSPKTIAALDALLASFKDDISTVLGLNEA